MPGDRFPEGWPPAASAWWGSPGPRLERLLRESPVGVVHLDAVTGQVEWNEAARRQHGLPAEGPLTHAMFYERVHPEDRERVRAAVERSVRGGEAVDIVYRVIREAGDDERWVRKISIPSYDDEGRWVRLDGVTIDVTEIEHRVAARTEELETAVSQMESFSSTVAHDLRAPLRHLHRFCEALLADYGERLGDGGRGYVRRMARAVTRLDGLTRDVLAYHKVSRGELPLTRVELSVLVRDMVTTYPELRPPARIIVEEPLPPVRANEPALIQCLSNLLGNAVKFVAPGVDPVVRVRAQARGPRVRILVSDNGVGVDPAHQDRLFAPFERLQPEVYEGTGIGLAIVKRAVERMKGEVGFESEPGKGSTFWVELPAA
jgi:PAS domain S-box-containing protein